MVLDCMTHEMLTGIAVARYGCHGLVLTLATLLKLSPWHHMFVIKLSAHSCQRTDYL